MLHHHRLQNDQAIILENYVSKLEELHEISQKGIEAIGNESDILENAMLTKECRDIKLSINGDRNDPLIMELIEESEKAGSLCTRVMGAGGGGFFICWAPKNKHAQIKEKLLK